MKRIILMMVAVCMASLTGYGVAQLSSISPVAMTTMTGAAPLDAALVTPTFGWVLTPDQLFTSHDGGHTFSAVDVPIPAGTARAAHFATPETGIVTASSGQSLTMARTTDGGRTWRTTAVSGAAPARAGYSSLNISFGDDAYGAVLARAATSQAFSLATIFITTDGGTSWSAHPAPEAGVVRVEPGGRIWLAGATLNSSTDHGRHWSPSALALAGPVTAATVSPPTATTLPVTVLVGDRTEVQLLTTTGGGHSWGDPTRLPVHGRTGPGVRLAVTDTPSGPVVYDTVAGHAYRQTGTDLRPSGLTDGVQSVTFTSDNRTGWALAGHGTCGANKRNCSYHHNLLVTTDGGATWRTAATWNHQI